MKVAALDAEAVAKFVRDLEGKGLSQSTVENYLLPLKGALDLAVRRNVIPINPYELLMDDEKPDEDEDDEDETHAYEWSDEEIKALLGSSELIARQPEARYDYSPVLEGAVRFGLRLGELLGLNPGDVDFKGRVLHVHRQWTKYGELTPPKTKRSRRRVPLTDDDVRFLRELRCDTIPPRRTSPSSSRAPARGSRTAMSSAEASRRRGIWPSCRRRSRFHDLRHAFASYAAHRGVPVTVLSAFSWATPTSA